ncbi:MAG: S8 family serine peptidase [Candidatus Sericytochromatia bacterium]
MSKRLSSLSLITLASLTLVSACQSGPVPQSTLPRPNVQMQAANSADLTSQRVVVGYQGTLSPAKIQQIEQQYGLRLVRNLPKIGVATFQAPNARFNFQPLTADPQVTFAGPDQSPRRIEGTPQYVNAPARTGSGDPLKAQQWSLAAVNAEQAWSVTTGSPNVIAAVVDTGVDLAHPDLMANLVPGYNAETPGQPPQDGHYHGTHVAGIIAAQANNGQGITGIAPSVKLMPVRAISNGGVTEVADGIVWAADNGAKVINLSLGWDNPSASVEQTIQRAVKYALDKNVVICAALSNASNNNPNSSPDNLAGKPGFEGVIGVGNVDVNNRRQGAWGNWKSVSSPGTQIMSTLPNNRYGNLTGTSMATPMVAGIVALMISQNPNLRNTEIRQKLMATAADLGTPGYDDQFGAGRVNAFAALNNVRLR